MSERVRWYNRLAAWAWDAIDVGGWWVNLAAPAWAEADPDGPHADEGGDEPWDYPDEDLREAYMEGYKDAEHKWRER